MTARFSRHSFPVTCVFYSPPLVRAHEGGGESRAPNGPDRKIAGPTAKGEAVRSLAVD